MSFCVNIKKIYYHGVVNSYKNVFPIIYINGYQGDNTDNG
jgi:hypothetical protein